MSNRHSKKTQQQFDQTSQWAPPVAPMPYGMQPQQPMPVQRKRKRVFLWFFLAVQIIFLIWIITGATSAANDHSACTGLSNTDCQSAKDAGAGLGVFLIIVVWAAVDLILGVSRLIVLTARRR